MKYKFVILKSVSAAMIVEKLRELICSDAHHVCQIKFIFAILKDF